PSIAVAFLFALHPLRVESVAWIAERKDVLSMLLALVTLHAWVQYAHRPRPWRYAIVLATTTMAIAAKPMMVTLPVLLLLCNECPPARRPTPNGDGLVASRARLIGELLPLFALSAAGAIVTMLACRSESGLVAVTDRPVGTRVAHALVSLVWYGW